MGTAELPELEEIAVHLVYLGILGFYYLLLEGKGLGERVNIIAQVNIIS